MYFEMNDLQKRLFLFRLDINKYIANVNAGIELHNFYLDKFQIIFKMTIE